MSRKHKKRGFTLIELMAVIAVFMVIITLGVVLTCVAVGRHYTHTHTGAQVAP